MCGGKRKSIAPASCEIFSIMSSERRSQEKSSPMSDRGAERENAHFFP
jgi:hypothetical protein